MIKTAMLNWIFEPNGGGVFRRVDKNTPLADAGTEVIDAGKLDSFIERLQSSEVAKQILSPIDFEILDTIRQVGFGLSGTATDAGTALSGAQIIGELFTIDGRKLIGGLARIRAQKTIAEFFTNENVINLMTTMGGKSKPKSYWQQVLFGYGSLADIAGKLSMDTQVEADEEELSPVLEGEEMFEGLETGSLNKQTEKLLSKGPPPFPSDRALY